MIRSIFACIALLPLWLSAHSIDWSYTEERIRHNPLHSEEDVAAHLEEVASVARQFSYEYHQSNDPFALVKSKKHIGLLPSFILKKRRHALQYRERLAWEIGCMLTMQRYLTPTYFVTINNSPLIVQKKCDFKKGRRLFEMPPYFLKMQPYDYWAANMLCYILGTKDLTWVNMGFDKKDSHPIFFDLEHCFAINNRFCVKKLDRPPNDIQYAVVFFYRASMLQPPLLTDPIDADTARAVRKLQHIIKKRRPFLEKHLTLTLEMPPKEQRSLLERVDRVLSLRIKKNMCFYDALQHLFPDMPKNFYRCAERISSLVFWDKREIGGSMWHMKPRPYWKRWPKKCSAANGILEILYRSKQRQKGKKVRRRG